MEKIFHVGDVVCIYRYDRLPGKEELEGICAKFWIQAQKDIAEYERKEKEAECHHTTASKGN